MKNKIYLKGLFDRKKLFRLLLIILVLVLLLIFLVGCKNFISEKVDEEKNDIFLRTVNFKTSLNLNSYSKYIERYSLENELYSVIFKDYKLRDKFLKKYKSDLSEVNLNLGMQSEYLKYLNLLNGSILIMILIIIFINVVLLLNYIGTKAKTIILYRILGYSVNKSVNIIVLFIISFIFMFSSILLVIPYFINNSLVNLIDLLLLIITFIAISIISKLFVRIFYKKLYNWLYY